MKACTSWRVANPYHVLQRLIDGCFVSGNYEDSEFFSKIKNAIVPVFGCNKGGNDTVMMLRVANHKDGNTKNCSQPLAAYEDGAENYWNLSKTIYHKDSPVKKFLQELLDDRLHTVVVMTKNQSGKIAES
jgi:hypothetical protein